MPAQIKHFLRILAEKGFVDLAYSIGAVTRTVVVPLQLGPVKYIRFLDFLNRSQWEPIEQLHAYQERKLKALVEYCYKRFNINDEQVAKNI